MPSKELVNEYQEIAIQTSAKIELSSNWKVVTKGAHIIYADVWISMEESDWSTRLDLLHNYQINNEMLKNARENAIFMHCLPAFHDLNTSISKDKANEYGKNN